jgi:microcompartment protein CcmK/EutM
MTKLTVDVGSADTGAFDVDEDVVGTDIGDWALVEWGVSASNRF